MNKRDNVCFLGCLLISITNFGDCNYFNFVLKVLVNIQQHQYLFSHIL